jgi:hypothetical protein
MFDRPTILDEAFSRRVAVHDFPAPRCSHIIETVAPDILVDLFDSQIMSRHLDLWARRSKGKTFYSIGSSGHEGTAAMAGRQCTSNYKILPILRCIRELAGLNGRRHNHFTDHLVTQTIGISWDEVGRMRDAPYAWVRNDYPLVDERITRWECQRAIAADDRFPDPARSACWHCPYRSDAEWRDLRNDEPEAFAKAVALDADMRSKPMAGAWATRTPYLHRSLVPLGEVNFDNAEDAGQQTLWDSECEGMCGL